MKTPEELESEIEEIKKTLNTILDTYNQFLYITEMLNIRVKELEKGVTKQ